MTTSETNTVDTPTSGQKLSWAVLAAAVLQVVAPLVTVLGPGTSPGGGSGPDLLITPVGWAFSIWGVIYALAIAQAVVQLRSGTQTVSRRLQTDLLALYLGGALWIAMAALDSSAATAAALLLMFVAATDAVLTVSRGTTTPGRLATLTRASVGLYAGWVTAAFFLNVATALVDAGAFEADDLPWQLVMVAVAVVTLLALTVLTRGIWTYAAAGAWALVGIAVTGSNDGTTEVTVAAVASAAVLVVVTVLLRLADERRPA